MLLTCNTYCDLQTLSLTLTFQRRRFTTLKLPPSMIVLSMLTQNLTIMLRRIRTHRLTLWLTLTYIWIRLYLLLERKLGSQYLQRRVTVILPTFGKVKMT